MKKITEEKRSLTPFQLAMKNFRRNRLAVGAALVLSLLFLGAIFADFLSLYRYDNENREYSYCPPAKIKIFDENGKITRP
jgi:peptide/nickel transport system permease protein